jgi:formamidopyrimidine-DNA glycosylase
MDVLPRAALGIVQAWRRVATVPELPDVAGFGRLVGRHLRRVRRVEVIDPAVVRNVEPARLEAVLCGKAVRRVERRGKLLVVDVADAALVVHFGMTGALVLADADAVRDRADRLVLADRAELRLRDERRLGRIWLATDEAELDRIIQPQGPDAARLTEPQLSAALHDRRGGVKAALMDQHVIAGLGNMLSDEILWRAGLRPRQRVSSLSSADVARLHAAIRDVVARSARAGHIPRTAGWLASQRASPDPSCPRCHGQLERSSVAGRTALWCPHCQAA